ncbi:MAG: PadR family transcriptional regulator [Gemmatimonadaceae bacterium]
MRDELMPGTLDMLILKAVSLAPMHGYAIAQHLRQVSKEVVQVEEGSLYPALQRVLAKKWVTAAWGETASKRRARFYTITTAGRKQLEGEVEGFLRMSTAIRRVISQT